MNIRQVEAFRTVMMRGSMTVAAQEMRTSQPSISRLIAELEASIGLTLFERRAGRIRPTPEGLSFYREVERSFLGLENLAHAARDIRAPGRWATVARRAPGVRLATPRPRPACPRSPRTAPPG